MQLDNMYAGKAFSPATILKKALSKEDTVITVENISVFPPGPNYATIGTDEDGETILYAVIAGDTLSGCTRGVEGTAKAWQQGELIARNFAEKDYAALVENVWKLNAGKAEAEHTHTAAEVSDTADKVWMLPAEREKLSGVATGANLYVHPTTHPASMITGLPTSLPANGGNADSLGGNTKTSSYYEALIQAEREKVAQLRADLMATNQLLNNKVDQEKAITAELAQDAVVGANVREIPLNKWALIVDAENGPPGAGWAFYLRVETGWHGFILCHSIDGVTRSCSCTYSVGPSSNGYRAWKV